MSCLPRLHQTLQDLFKNCHWRRLMEIVVHPSTNTKKVPRSTEAGARASSFTVDFLRMAPNRNRIYFRLRSEAAPTQARYLWVVGKREYNVGGRWESRIRSDHT